MTSKTFIPHPLLRSGMLQTVIGNITGKTAAPLRYDSMEVLLFDGDRLLLHCDAPIPSSEQAPILFIVHGLGGDSESDYQLRISRKLTSQGVRVVRFNHRGCGRGAAAMAREIYHGGRGADVAAALKAVSSRWPHAPLSVAAFSLSANMVLKLLSKQVDLQIQVPTLTKVLAVCPPIDLEACSVAISSWRNIWIDQYYARRMLTIAREKTNLFPDVPLTALPRFFSIRTFDELYVAPRGGFRNRSDYYTKSSAKPDLQQIKVPTRIIAAADDPIIPPSSFDGAKFSATTEFLMQPSGGHMGFISKELTRFGDRRWMDAAVVTWALES